jgi:hypothetical protein
MLIWRSTGSVVTDNVDVASVEIAVVAAEEGGAIVGKCFLGDIVRGTMERGMGGYILVDVR